MSKRQPKTPAAPIGDHEVIIVKSGAEGNPRHRMLIVTPTLGKVRVEWAIYRYGQVIPCNWSASNQNVGVRQMVPMHYLVAEGQNIAVQHCIQHDFEWLLLWEDDVIAPIDAFCKLNQYVNSGKYPVVSGLYFTKGYYSEPILYRGRGNSYFKQWRFGDKVMCDGVPTGFLLIHCSVLKLMYDESPQYTSIGGLTLRKVFETPATVRWDNHKRALDLIKGTSDLYWCKRVIREKVLERSGWKKFAGEKNPFLCDTNIFCQHIEFETGKQYPMPHQIDKRHATRKT